VKLLPVPHSRCCYSRARCRSEGQGAARDIWWDKGRGGRIRGLLAANERAAARGTPPRGRDEDKEEEEEEEEEEGDEEDEEEDEEEVMGWLLAFLRRGAVQMSVRITDLRCDFHPEAPPPARDTHTPKRDLLNH